MGQLVIVTTDRDDDFSCTVLYNKVIKPRVRDGEWVDIDVKRSGITWEDYHSGVPYEEAISDSKELLKDAIVVGHNIKCDFNALELSNAHCVYDTATNASLNDLVPSERGKAQSKLAGLAYSLLGRTIQSATAHDPVEDATENLFKILYRSVQGDPR